MSVRLESKNGDISDEVCNGSWAALIAAARAYEYDKDKIPAWNGCHDGQEWTPEQLTLIADRVEQMARLIPLVRDLAANGGVRIS